MNAVPRLIKVSLSHRVPAAGAGLPSRGIIVCSWMRVEAVALGRQPFRGVEPGVACNDAPDGQREFLILSKEL